jgi:inhibitor of the pro-sigma K processing machinery
MEYLGFIGAIIALIIIVKILAWPVKKIIKLGINVALGVALLFIFNSFGAGWFGITLPINWITALIVGLLGIPGFIGVLVFFLIF